MLTQYHIHNFQLEFCGNHKETQIFNGKVEKLLELIVIYYFCYVHPFWYGNTIFFFTPTVFVLFLHSFIGVYCLHFLWQLVTFDYLLFSLVLFTYTIPATPQRS